MTLIYLKWEEGFGGGQARDGWVVEGNGCAENLGERGKGKEGTKARGGEFLLQIKIRIIEK